MKTSKSKVAKKAKSKTNDVIKSVSDDYGNLLLCKNNGKRVILTLKLVSEKPKSRRVGIINIARKTIEVRRKRAVHLFRANGAYGFNHKLLSETKMFDKVRLMDEKAEWLIPNEFILKNGNFLHFIQNGFEKQIFIPLTEIKQFVREPKF